MRLVQDSRRNSIFQDGIQNNNDGEAKEHGEEAERGGGRSG